MRLVGSREAAIVTGLSANRLREWTGRRGLVSPDFPARGKGTQARFSWQTLLVLRLAAVLRDRLHVELEAYRASLKMLQARLRNEAFHGLGGGFVAIGIGRAALLRSVNEPDLQADEAVCVLILQPHLDAIGSVISISQPTAQRNLFPAMAVR
jgi:hypothetical protein